MKKAGKRRMAPKKVSERIGGLTLLEREQRALAEADPFRGAPSSRPAPPSLPEIAPPPKSFAERIEAPSVPAPDVEAPRFGASPVAASEPPLEGSADIKAFRRALGGGPVMSRGKLAVLAFVVTAACGVALVRACEPKGAPIEDDAAGTDSCSDDASLCVARA